MGPWIGAGHVSGALERVASLGQIGEAGGQIPPVLHDHSSSCEHLAPQQVRLVEPGCLPGGRVTGCQCPVEPLVEQGHQPFEEARGFQRGTTAGLQILLGRRAEARLQCLLPHVAQLLDGDALHLVEGIAVHERSALGKGEGGLRCPVAHPPRLLQVLPGQGWLTQRQVAASQGVAGRSGRGPAELPGPCRHGIHARAHERPLGPHVVQGQGIGIAQEAFHALDLLTELLGEAGALRSS